MVTAFAANFIFVTLPSASSAVPIVPGPGDEISESLAKVPSPSGRVKFTSAPFEMNTALFKPSNVIASVVEPTLLLFNLNASSKEFKTDESKSLAVIVPSKILSVVTASVASLGFVTLPFAN